MNIISMYLPQFHRTKENDEWWGEGYTDWEAVKSAEPLFENHYQPRVPQFQNYYDLLEMETFQWQAKLMEKYSIYGQCFYHYWFKDGKKVLERPAENLLKWKNIKMPFCFCWANESWVRSWSAIVDSNTWAPRFEKSTQKNTDTGTLLKQDYGTEKDWEKHFNYFLQFFKDERYIKIDGKPVVMIFRPDNITCLVEMIDLWRKLAIENGFPGLYIIGGNTERQKNMDARYVHIVGSMFPASLYELKNGVKTIKYEDVWHFIGELAASEQAGVYVGGITDFDTTARKGKSGVVILDANEKTYEKGLKKLLFENEKHNVPFTFINAWNEWGEGMYLEPDEVRGVSFLEATQRAKETYHDMTDAIMDNNGSLINFYKEKANQYKLYWRLMDHWMQKKENGVCLSQPLEKNGIHSIAIYGIGILGQHLYKDIKESEIQIKYFIDARRSGMQDGIEIVVPDHVMEDVDAIIVSVVYEYEDIKKKMQLYSSVPIISLEELVFEV